MQESVASQEPSEGGGDPIQTTGQTLPGIPALYVPPSLQNKFFNINPDISTNLDIKNVHPFSIFKIVSFHCRFQLLPS
jgi:hypothetical protein